MRQNKNFGITLFIIGAMTVIAALILGPDRTPALSASLALHRAYRLIALYLGGFICLLGGFLTILHQERFQRFSGWLKDSLRSEKGLFGMILLAGVIVRSTHLLFVGISSPYRYGGLFLEFARQIFLNPYRFPDTIPFYTLGGIPFAYPPLPFYIEGILVYLLGFSAFAVVNLLPVVVAILSLPLFYLLTRAAGLSRRIALLAFAAFAIMPNAFIDQIEGAGLAEAFGTLAILWFLIECFKILQGASLPHSLRQFLLLGVSWAVCIVSSPGSAYASVLVFLGFSIVLLRDKSFRPSIGKLVLSGITAMVLSCPYWLTVIVNHGAGVFLGSFSSQQNSYLADTIGNLLDFQITTGPYVFLWNLAIFFGILISILEKRAFLLITFLTFVLIPREGRWLVAIPSALLIGIAIDKIQKIPQDFLKIGKSRMKKLYAGVLVGLLVLLGPLTNMLVNPLSPEAVLPPGSIQAMDWVRFNTPPSVKVVVLSSSQVQEWLPQISQRTVINQPFGAEWQPQEGALISKMEDALKKCTDLDCTYRSGQEILNGDSFILFSDRVRFESMEQHPGSKVQWIPLWENEGFIIGKLCRVASCL
ncbi:MAG: hypothetical protein NTZ74_00380 [Chloroflexi bacterium]|nr:hypothetical protein [Chloroflexota bacterium]